MAKRLAISTRDIGIVSSLAEPEDARERGFPGDLKWRVIGPPPRDPRRSAHEEMT